MYQNIILKAVTTAIVSSVFMLNMPSNAMASEPIKTIAKASLPAKQQLRFKLQEIQHFNATFTQTIMDEQGEVLQTAEGMLTVAKPNKVNWHTQKPDETLIVSDGSTLWFYDPFIEQATAYNVNETIENTPILLITNNDAKVWQKFDVNQITKATFEVVSTEPNSRVESLSITFDEKSMITSFRIKDATGQISQVSLSNVDSKTKPIEDKFLFKVPEGVALDDQR